MTNKQTSILRFIPAILYFFALVHPSPAQDISVLQERLHKAIETNSLDAASMNPWHIKLSFQLFDPKGSPTETGTIEEWWFSPSMHKTVYTSPSYNATELKTENGSYRSKDASSPPLLLELILDQTIHPMPTETEIADSKLSLEKKSFSKVQLDCVMLGQSIQGLAQAPLGLFPTYCFNQNDDTLRISFNFGAQTIIRNNIGTFLNKYIAQNLVTNLGQVPAISAHVDQLQNIPGPHGVYVADESFTRVPDAAPTVDAKVLSGKKISGPPPVYPESARKRGAQGTVIINAVIGKDGRIHSMKLASVPDPDLAIAALYAVRQWTYTPYLLNGQPTEVRTSITVNFKFSSTFQKK